MNKNELTIAVKEIKEWLKTQPHLPQCVSDDEQLLTSFIVGYYSLDFAKLKLDAYFSLRNRYKEPFFKNRDPRALKWYSVKKYFFLPGTTPEGDYVIMTIFPAPEVQKYFSAAESAKFNFMLLDSYLREHSCDRPFSVYLITDMANLSNQIINKLNKDYSRECSEIMEAYPIKIKGMISLNGQTQGEAFCDEFHKPYYNEDIKAKIIVEKNDHRSLSKYIPPEMLPSDYEGGNNLPVKAIWEATKQRLERERDWFITAGSQTTNERLRL